MSRAVLMGILSEMHLWLSEIEMGQLYNELIAYFGLIGALDECQALENAWKDPYNRREIEGCIFQCFLRNAAISFLNSLKSLMFLTLSNTSLSSTSAYL